MSRFSHYRAALYLSATLALIETIWILSFMPRRPEVAKAFIITLIMTMIIVLGLWVQSNLIRYIGAVGMVIWAGALIWPLILGGTAPLISRPTDYVPVFLYYSFSGVLCLLTAAILLFSKQFANEFANRLNSQPKYKRNLRRLLIGAIIFAMLIATVNDIVNLANAP